VIDDTSTEKSTPFRIPSHSPRVARSFRKQLKVSRTGVDSKESTGEVELTSAVLDVTRIEDTIQAIQITVRPPRQRIGQLMGIGSAKPRDNHFSFIRFAIAIRVL